MLMALSSHQISCKWTRGNVLFWLGWLKFGQIIKFEWRSISFLKTYEKSRVMVSWILDLGINSKIPMVLVPFVSRPSVVLAKKAFVSIFVLGDYICFQSSLLIERWLRLLYFSPFSCWLCLRLCPNLIRPYTHSHRLPRISIRPYSPRPLVILWRSNAITIAITPTWSRNDVVFRILPRIWPKCGDTMICLKWG